MLGRGFVIGDAAVMEQPPETWAGRRGGGMPPSVVQSARSTKRLARARVHEDFDADVLRTERADAVLEETERIAAHRHIARYVGASIMNVKRPSVLGAMAPPLACAGRAGVTQLAS